MSFGLSASTWTAISVGTAAVSTGVAVKGQREQRKAQEAQSQVRAAQETRQRLAQVRKQRIAQAQVMQSAATEGTQNSSSARGGMSSMGSQTASNLGFIQGVSNIQETVASRMNKASQYASTAQGLNSMANLGLQAADLTE